MEIRVHNVVVSAAFKHGVDLNAIVKAFPHIKYRPERFPDAACLAMSVHDERWKLGLRSFSSDIALMSLGREILEP